MNPQEITTGLQNFGLAIVPALFGIICHEVAHGWAAWKMGDPTAKHLGRLTLNPIRHIDPMGLGVFAFTALFAPFAIGWAKPVPVQSRYFRRPREGMMLVAAAGPLANFLVAIICAFIVKLTINLSQSGIGSGTFALWAINQSALTGVMINCVLAWFNLMPVPPLDGGHILGGLLPDKLARSYERLAPYGMIIVLLLLATDFFGNADTLFSLLLKNYAFILSLVGL
jgi:Zn-dependent protease